jgi:hypothetical protein
VRRVLLAVALSLAPLASYAAEPLGRLFYTPAQRAQLDAARSQKSRAAPAAEPEEPPPLPEVVTYDGVVRRSDGRTTVWINNRAINDGKAPPGGAPVTSRLRPDGSVSLGITQSDRSVNLKVGQSVEIVSGTIAEPYSRARGSDKAAGKPAVSQPKPASTGAPTGARAAPATRRDADGNGADPR